MYGEIREVRWMTPALVRVVLGGPGVDGFARPEDTDAYINIALPPDGAPYSAPFDPAEIRERYDRSLWPARRRYTVRSWDAATRELSVDFVVHGDSGVAGPWAAATQPGDLLVFEGPGSGYRPDPAADWHLLIGDESALPAIAASLELLPPDAVAVVRLVCDTPAHELVVDAPNATDLRWVHRAGADDVSGVLPAAVRDLSFPAGRVHAFVHGEADEIRAIRRHLIADRGLARSDMSCSPYWRRAMTDESWRAVKRDYVAAMEAETA